MKPLTDVLMKVLHALGLASTPGNHAQLNSTDVSRENERFLVGLAKRLVSQHPFIRAHLSGIPHLGLLEVQQGVTPRSRWDYCLDQCQILHRIKETKPGLGLSNHLSELDSVGLRGLKVTALEVLQLGVILTNMGHLFGTFSTERALLFCLFHSNPEFRTQLIEEIPAAVRDTGRRILDRQFMYQVYEVIALWRLGRDPYSDLERQQCIACMRILTEDDISSKISTLKSIFKFVRRLSYLRLHVELGVTSLLDHDLFSDEVIDFVIQHEDLHYDSEVQLETPAERLLKAIDEYQYETFFVSENTASIVLEHLREFKQWWMQQEAEDISLPKRLEALYTRPASWPSLPEPESLKFFVRLELPRSNVAAITGIADWWQKGDPWGTSNFYISQGPASAHSNVDIFVAKGIEPRTAAHVAERLSIELKREGLSRDDRIRLDRSVARYAVCLIGEILKDRWQLRVRRAIGRSGQPALVVLSQSVHLTDFCTELTRQQEDLDDSGRAEEIEGIVEYLKFCEQSSNTNGLGSSFMLAFVGRTFLVGAEPSDKGRGSAKKPRYFDRELDGIVAFISKSEIQWHLIEVKGRPKNRPGKQSNEVRDFFVSSAGPVVPVSVNGFRMAAFEVVWRG